MNNVRLFLVGDPPSTSDVGKFCLRLRDSGYNPKPVFIDSSLGAAAIAKLNQERLTRINLVACNVVNNVNLFSNVLFSRKLAQKLSSPITYIIHDGKVEYPAHIAAMISAGNDEYIKKYAAIGHNVESFVNECIPGHLFGRFTHGYDYEKRGEMLLGLLLKNSDSIFCHSHYCKTIVEKSLEIFTKPSLTKISVIPLAYGDHQYSGGLHEDHLIALQQTDTQIKFGLYGMFFSSAKNIDLLVDVLKYLEAMGIPCSIWLSGRVETEIAAALEKRLTFLTGGFVFHGFVDEDKLNSLIRESHFIWAYRNPTHGESSGTVLRALAHGTCPIVCNIGAYSEIPSSLVLAFSPSASPAEIANTVHESFHSTQAQSKSRVLFIQDFHSPRLYLNRMLSLQANYPRTPESLNEYEDSGVTSEGLVYDGYLLPSLVSFSSSTPAEVVPLNPSFSHEEKGRHTRIGTLHIGFDGYLADLYRVACSPAAKIISAHKNPYQFTTRYDYLYFVLKEMLESELSSPLVASDLMITTATDLYGTAMLDVGAHIDSVARAVRDYYEWHSETDRDNRLLDTLINLGGLELLAPLRMLLYSVETPPWSIEDCWTASIIYFDRVSALFREASRTKDERWLRVLARSEDVVTSVICSSVARRIPKHQKVVV